MARVKENIQWGTWNKETNNSLLYLLYSDYLLECILYDESDESNCILTCEATPNSRTNESLTGGNNWIK